MNFLAVITPRSNASIVETQALFIVLFFAYVLVSFLRVAMYTAGQVKQGRLLASGNAPLPWTLPTAMGWAFVSAVLLMLFLQAELYMIVVVTGLLLFLLEMRRTGVEQFGLARLPVNKLIKWSFLVCGAVIFVEFPLDAFLQWLFNTINLPHPQQESVEAFRGFTTWSQIIKFLLTAVVISPLMEELFFRGFLLTFLKGRMTTWLALLVSSAVFALAHANTGALVQLWVLGIVLGIAYEHTGSLLLPIGIHGCWNLLTAVTLLFEKGT